MKFLLFPLLVLLQVQIIFSEECACKDTSNDRPDPEELIPPEFRSVEERPVIDSSLKFQNHRGHLIELVPQDNQVTCVSFFYTRCVNPNKCSAAIKTLHKLSLEVSKRGLSDKIKVYGITYTPEVDTESVMSSYLKSLGIDDASGLELIRLVDCDPLSSSKLRSSFELKASFDSTKVSIHRIQLNVLDSSNRTAAIFDTTIWDNDRVIDYILTLLEE